MLHARSRLEAGEGEGVLAVPALLFQWLWLRSWFCLCQVLLEMGKPALCPHCLVDAGWMPVGCWMDVGLCPPDLLGQLSLLPLQGHRG